MSNVVSMPKRKVKPRKLKNRMHIQVNDQQREALDVQADALSFTRAQLCRFILADWLQQRELKRA